MPDRGAGAELGGRPQPPGRRKKSCSASRRPLSLQIPPRVRGRGPPPPQAGHRDRAATRPQRSPPCVLSDISGWSLSLVGLVPRAAPTCNDTSRLLADVTDSFLANAGSGAVRTRRAVVKRPAVHPAVLSLCKSPRESEA